MRYSCVPCVQSAIPEDAVVQPPAKFFSRRFALGLLGMTHLEEIREVGTDTFALIGYGPGRVILAFRGTASKQNVMTDIKAWSVPYPPHPRLSRADLKKEGWVQKATRGLPVRVHAGFYGAWTGDDFNKRVMAKVMDAAVSAAAEEGNGAKPGGSSEQPCRILVTGHSVSELYRAYTPRMQCSSGRKRSNTSEQSVTLNYLPVSGAKCSLVGPWRCLQERRLLRLCPMRKSSATPLGRPAWGTPPSPPTPEL